MLFFLFVEVVGFVLFVEAVFPDVVVAVLVVVAVVVAVLVVVAVVVVVVESFVAFAQQIVVVDLLVVVAVVVLAGAVAKTAALVAGLPALFLAVALAALVFLCLCHAVQLFVVVGSVVAVVVVFVLFDQDVVDSVAVAVVLVAVDCLFLQSGH